MNYTLLSPAVTFPLTGEPYSQCYRIKSTPNTLSLFIASDISTTSRFSRRKACDNLGLCLRERCLLCRQRGCSDRLSLHPTGISTTNDFLRKSGLCVGRAVACKATERGLQFLRIRNPSPSSLRDATSPRGEAHSQNSLQTPIS